MRKKKHQQYFKKNHHPKSKNNISEQNLGYRIHFFSLFLIEDLTSMWNFEEEAILTDVEPSATTTTITPYRAPEKYVLLRTNPCWKKNKHLLPLNSATLHSCRNPAAPNQPWPVWLSSKNTIYIRNLNSDRGFDVPAGYSRNMNFYQKQKDPKQWGFGNPTKIESPSLVRGDKTVRLEVYCSAPSLKFPMGSQRLLPEPRTSLVVLSFEPQ